MVARQVFPRHGCGLGMPSCHQVSKEHAVADDVVDPRVGQRPFHVAPAERQRGSGCVGQAVHASAHGQALLAGTALRIGQSRRNVGHDFVNPRNSLLAPCRKDH